MTSAGVLKNPSGHRALIRPSTVPSTPDAFVRVAIVEAALHWTASVLGGFNWSIQRAG